MQTKVCSDCRQLQPICEFYPRKRGSHLYKSECKRCSHKRKAIWFKKNPEKKKAQDAEYAKKLRS